MEWNEFKIRLKRWFHNARTCCGATLLVCVCVSARFVRLCTTRSCATTKCIYNAVRRQAFLQIICYRRMSWLAASGEEHFNCRTNTFYALHLCVAWTVYISVLSNFSFIFIPAHREFDRIINQLQLFPNRSQFRDLDLFSKFHFKRFSDTRVCDCIKFKFQFDVSEFWPTTKVKRKREWKREIEKKKAKKRFKFTKLIK